MRIRSDHHHLDADATPCCPASVHASVPNGAIKVRCFRMRAGSDAIDEGWRPVVHVAFALACTNRRDTVELDRPMAPGTASAAAS
jgi:hypothetical protein